MDVRDECTFYRGANSDREFTDGLYFNPSVHLNIYEPRVPFRQRAMPLFTRATVSREKSERAVFFVDVERAGREGRWVQRHLKSAFREPIVHWTCFREQANKSADT